MKSDSLRMIVIATLITVVVVVGHLLPGLDATEIDREIRNSLHVIGFALIAAVIFEALPLSAARAAFTTLSIVAVLGALAEFVQSLDGKGFDLADLFRDVAGAVLYLVARVLWNWTKAPGRSSIVGFAARLVSVALAALLFIPLSYWLYVKAGIAAKFPTIIDFDGRWDSYTYIPVNSEVTLVKGGSSGEKNAGVFADILLQHRSWSGLNIKPVVSDWSSFQFLTMRAAVIGDHESTITLDISDVAHPGYRIQHHVGSSSAGPELTVIRFPLHAASELPGRPALDLSNVTAVYIIAKTGRKGKNNSAEIRMILDDIRLE